MRDDYDMRRRFTVNAFREIGLDCFEPEGAFYVFPCIKSTGLSSEDFANGLLWLSTLRLFRAMPLAIAVKDLYVYLIAILLIILRKR